MYMYCLWHCFWGYNCFSMLFCAQTVQWNWSFTHTHPYIIYVKDHYIYCLHVWNTSYTRHEMCMESDRVNFFLRYSNFWQKLVFLGRHKICMYQHWPETSTMSPGTSSLALMRWTPRWFFRMTLAISGSYSFKASMASSAFLSCKYTATQFRREQSW